MAGNVGTAKTQPAAAAAEMCMIRVNSWFRFSPNKKYKPQITRNITNRAEWFSCSFASLQKHCNQARLSGCVRSLSVNRRQSSQTFLLHSHARSRIPAPPIHGRRFLRRVRWDWRSRRQCQPACRVTALQPVASLDQAAY